MLNPSPVPISTETRRRQRARNWAIFGLLLAFVVIVFAVTIVKLKAPS